jgi:hypothetical protein
MPARAEVQDGMRRECVEPGVQRKLLGHPSSRIRMMENTISKKGHVHKVLDYSTRKSLATRYNTSGWITKRETLACILSFCYRSTYMYRHPSGN